MIIRPHDPNGENPAARPLQLRRSDILQPGTSVPGALPHRDHAPIGRNLTVTKREKATLASHLAFIYAGDDRSLPLSEAEGLHTLSRAVQSAQRGLMRQGITRCEVNSERPWNTLRRLGAQKNSWCAPSYCRLYESGTGPLLRY